MTKVAELDRLAAKSWGLILCGFRDVQEAELLGRYQERGWRLGGSASLGMNGPSRCHPEGSFTWVAWLLRRPAKIKR